MSVAEKERHELRYWAARKAAQGTLRNDHYAHFYTQFFGLSVADFEGRSILDVGCGPRGSLEWATLAACRVGLDPLVDDYLRLGAASHEMEYRRGYAEAIPAEDESFDFVCSFNSIDHVDDLTRTCREISRVLKRGGLLLLLTDVHEEPTICEPQAIRWDFVDSYFGDHAVLDERHVLKTRKGIYDSLRDAVPYDRVEHAGAPGILAAKLRKIHR